MNRALLRIIVSPTGATDHQEVIQIYERMTQGVLATSDDVVEIHAVETVALNFLLEASHIMPDVDIDVYDSTDAPGQMAVT